jgi:hypothetical protein
MALESLVVTYGSCPQKEYEDAEQRLCILLGLKIVWLIFSHP